MAGFVTESLAVSSHAAIFLEGLGIPVVGAVEHPSQAPLVLQKKMAGIGLFRTEFLALERGFLPDESAAVLTGNMKKDNDCNRLQ